MQCTLIDYTGSGHPNPADYAAGILIFTKNTRLNMVPGLLKETMDKPYDDKIDELRYMANTIPSSWEFVEYTFLLTGVSRAFTHQLVRTRTASFAQQTMRVLDVSEGSGWDYLTGPSIANGEDCLLNSIYSTTMDHIAEVYKTLIKNGAAIEDARGILPTNILTNIVVKLNMRNLVELIYKRSSPRVQGEYREALDAMKSAAVQVHPWLPIFIDRTFDRAAADLDKAINEFSLNDFIPYGDCYPEFDNDKLKAWKTDLIKLVDQLRAKQ